jgi:F-type H+-transporting ATPase subunit b
MAEAKHDAEVMRADMIAKAQEESQAIIAKAHDVIDAERAKAMAELSGSVVDLSVEIASKVIGNGLDVEQQRALAIKYLAEVGSLNDD